MIRPILGFFFNGKRVNRMKKSIVILNCCPLGADEVDFWNSLFDRYRDEYCFHFFTTTIHNDLKADEVIKVDYGAHVFENKHGSLSDQLRLMIDRVAQK